MTDLQHYLLILFVGEASSRAHLSPAVTECPPVRRIMMKMPEFLQCYKMPFWRRPRLGAFVFTFSPLPPVNLLSLKSFYSFMCNVENVDQLCVLTVLPFGRLAFQRSVLYSSRNFSHLGVQRLIADRFRLMYQEK